MSRIYEALLVAPKKKKKKLRYTFVFNSIHMDIFRVDLSPLTGDDAF